MVARRPPLLMFKGPQLQLPPLTTTPISKRKYLNPNYMSQKLTETNIDIEVFPYFSLQSIFGFTTRSAEEPLRCEKSEEQCSKLGGWGSVPPDHPSPSPPYPHLHHQTPG